MKYAGLFFLFCTIWTSSDNFRQVWTFLILESRSLGLNIDIKGNKSSFHLWLFRYENLGEILIILYEFGQFYTNLALKVKALK